MSPKQRDEGPGAGPAVPGLRVAVYTDYSYHRLDDGVYAERAFGLFIARLAERTEKLVLVGRLDPRSGRARYPIGSRIEFVGLPFYESLAQPLRALRAMAGSLGQLWRSLDDVNCVWLLGPHPLALPYVAIAAIRRRHVVLGVRQNLPTLIRSRHPRRPLMRLAARALEGCYRLLARRIPVVVVGPDIHRNYRHAPRLLEMTVSLVTESDIVAGATAHDRDYGGELTVLSVGRLDAEKNPLLLADVISLLRTREPRWRMVVCGEGSMEDDLAMRLEQLGVAGSVELRGYVPLERGLGELYRTSHALLHVSWTEGLPQILFEAFAAGLPVVATDVGGIAEAAGGAVRLVPPGDAAGAAQELGRIADDEALRADLIEAGRDLVRAHTLDAETRNVAEFLSAATE